MHADAVADGGGGDGGGAGGGGGGDGGGDGNSGGGALGGGGGFGGLGGSGRLGAELPISAPMVNCDAVRAGVVPSFSAFGTARALASLLGAAGRGEIAPPRALDVDVGVEESSVFGERRWGLGVQRYACTGGLEVTGVIGLHSASGSFAFFAPATGVSAAILINDASLEYGPTRAIIDLVGEELGLGRIDFLEGGLF